MALHYDGELKITKVAGMSAMMNNGYLITCPETNECILIDTPGEPEKLLNSITTKLLPLSDDTAVYPGHGDDTTIGEARRRHADFSSRSHPADLSGDVDWLKS